jgi:hypothetical protein
MTLDETLLRKLSETPAAEGRHTLTVPDEVSGWVATLTLDRRDDVACVLWEMALRRLATPPAAGAALEDWADRVTGRVTGLLEPLAVVEVDAQRNEALLRSHEPTRRGEALSYYEVLLKGTREAVARRYKGARNGDRRQQVAFTLTHEVLAKFAADLAADA